MANQDELTLARTGAWHENEIRRLENMVASGFDNELIAKALGRKLQGVATRVHYVKKRQADETSRLHKKWTPDEVATLESMLKAKASHKKIAATLKRSTKAINQRVLKLRKAKRKAKHDIWRGAVTEALEIAPIPQQIFTKPMPQPEIKPITLTPEQRAWSKPEPQTHRNAAWAAVAVAVGLAGFILGGLAQ